MRLFIAVNFDDETKNRLLKVQEQLRSGASGGNFTRSENLHLTLAFLGETPDDKLEILFRIMEEVRASPFDVSFNKTGCFSRSHRKLWWIGMDRNSPGLSCLEAIHGQLLSLLLDAGFLVDKRPFNAHITLGREVLHTHPVVLDYPAISINVDRISLMKSEHHGGVLIYTELYGRRFSG